MTASQPRLSYTGIANTTKFVHGRLRGLKYIIKCRASIAESEKSSRENYRCENKIKTKTDKGRGYNQQAGLFKTAMDKLNGRAYKGSIQDHLSVTSRRSRPCPDKPLTENVL